MACTSKPAGCAISVSADGSTWFLGQGDAGTGEQPDIFQYPLMDRLGFWGYRDVSVWTAARAYFSIR